MPRALFAVLFHFFYRLKQYPFESPLGRLAGFSPFILFHPIAVTMQQASGKGIFIINGSLIAVFAESAVSFVKFLCIYAFVLRNKFALRFYKFTQAGIRIICFCWQIAYARFEQLVFRTGKNVSVVPQIPVICQCLRDNGIALGKKVIQEIEITLLRRDGIGKGNAYDSLFQA